MQVRLIFLLFLIFPLAFSFDCTLRTGNCNSNEVCILRMFERNNSHAASCDYTSYNYVICCDTIKFSSVKQSCLNDEGGILSLAKLNDSHVEKYNYSNYPYHVCAKFDIGSPVTTYIRENGCFPNETIVASIHDLTNSHIAEPNYYNKKVCISKYSDLLLNQSSIELNDSYIVVGEAVNITIKVFNVGDVYSYDVKVKCYDNSTFFGEYTIPSIAPNSYGLAYCLWNSVCNIQHNLTFVVDENNEIFEYNETNNNFTQSVNLIEKLFITIDNPSNNSIIYRNKTVSLNSTVHASCNPVSNYNVYWYNDSYLIGIGEDINWKVPLDDNVLGIRNITAFVNKTGLVENSDSIFVTISNNIPLVDTEISKDEVEVGDSLRVYCSVKDEEDSVDFLKVNVSILNSNDEWINSTATKLTGNIFYKDFSIPFNAPLGIYKAYCVVLDTDNGYNETFKSFVVYQNVSIIISLNKKTFWWNESIVSSLKIVRRNGSNVVNGYVNISLDKEKKCEGYTNNEGKFSCTFLAPLRIGLFNLDVVVQDPLSTKYFFNSTIIEIKLSIGEDIEKAKIVSCHEEPRLIINPDGTIQLVKVKVCVVRK
ncbi:MAG: CARDB domain-containing protein [Candidatus Aenigmatarchaeota archaeon]